MRITRRRTTLSGVSLRPLRQRRMSETPRSTNRRSRSATRRRLSGRGTSRHTLITNCNHSATMMGDVAFTRVVATHTRCPSRSASHQSHDDDDSTSTLDTSNSAVHSSGSRSSSSSTAARITRASTSRSRSGVRRRLTCPTRRASTIARKRSLSRSRTRRAASSKRARLTEPKSSTNDASQSSTQSTTNVPEQPVDESKGTETPEGSPKPDKPTPDNDEQQIDGNSQNQCCSALFTSEPTNPSMPFLIGVRRRVRTVPTVTVPTPSSISTGLSVSAQYPTSRSSWPECTPAQQTPLSSIDVGMRHELNYGTCGPHSEEATLHSYDAGELVVEPDSDEDENDEEEEEDCDVNEDLLMEHDHSQPQPCEQNVAENPSDSQHEDHFFSSYSTQEDSIS